MAAFLRFFDGFFDADLKVRQQILQEFRPQDPRVMMLIRQDRLFLLTEVPEMTLLP
jgi:hypothetical protein